MSKTLLSMLVGLLIAAACSPASQDADAGGSEDAAVRNVVDIVATNHTFDAPDEIPSGWTTFRFENNTAETHFALIDLLPEGRTAEDSAQEVAPVFQDAMDLINAGDPDAGFAEFENLPEWSADIVYMGGPGFVAPGGTVETTVNLEPGTYAIECYVKTEDGVFHTTHGMITGLTVTEESSDAEEPDADVEVTVSSEDGFTIDGDLQSGEQTIAVHFEDQTVHGNVLGHDVHLARVDDTTDLDELAAWMNWIGGLEGDPPAEFVGGAHDMPAGNTAYFTVDLSPGEYVFIAEVDEPAEKNMLQPVTVD